MDVGEEMNKLRKLMKEKKAGTLSNVSEDELEQYTKTMPEDKVFNKFNKRVARHPDQVLRYDRGGQPLWITGNSGHSNVNVPKCQYCNGERQFEFQVSMEYSCKVGHIIATTGSKLDLHSLKLISKFCFR